jgi:hypothetical protein
VEEEQPRERIDTHLAEVDATNLATDEAPASEETAAVAREEEAAPSSRKKTTKGGKVSTLCN